MFKDFVLFYPYSFTFKDFILVHEYIHSHSTTTWSFNMYTNSYSVTYFSVTNKFIHIRNIYSFTFKVIIFIQHLLSSIQHIVNVQNSQIPHSFTLNNLIFFTNIFIHVCDKYSFTFNDKIFILPCWKINLTFCGHPSFLHLETRFFFLTHQDTKQRFSSFNGRY